MVLKRAILPLLLMTLLTVTGCGGKSAADKNQPVQPATATMAPQPPVDHTNDPVVLALGDSLTAGLGVQPEQAWPSLVQQKIDEARLGYRVVNAGISGDTSAGGASRVDALLEQNKPAVVVLELGANDGLRGLAVEQMQQNLATIIEHSQKAGAQILLAGMQVPTNFGPEYQQAFAGVFPGLAKQYKTSLIPFFLDGVGGKPELNQLDAIHPTAEGHKIVANLVWQHLKPMLQPK